MSNDDINVGSPAVSAKTRLVVAELHLFNYVYTLKPWAYRAKRREPEGIVIFSYIIRYRLHSRLGPVKMPSQKKMLPTSR